MSGSSELMISTETKSPGGPAKQKLHGGDDKGDVPVKTSQRMNQGTKPK